VTGIPAPVRAHLARATRSAAAPSRTGASSRRARTGRPRTPRPGFSSCCRRGCQAAGGLVPCSRRRRCQCGFPWRLPELTCPERQSLGCRVPLGPALSLSVSTREWRIRFRRPGNGFLLGRRRQGRRLGGIVPAEGLPLPGLGGELQGHAVAVGGVADGHVVGADYLYAGTGEDLVSDGAAVRIIRPLP